MTRGLIEFADGVWIASQGGKFLGVETGSRMAVVKLSDNWVFVYSPIALNPEIHGDIAAIGEVVAVVAPSLFHHLYVREWMDSFPSAKFLACPGLDWKRPDLAFAGVVADSPDSLWAGDLDQVYFSSRRENEVVFFHRHSGTLLCADSLLNLSQHETRATRWVARIMGNHAPGVGHLERFMIRDRRLARRQVDRMLMWDIRKIVLAHGPTIESGGRNVLEHAYAWL